MESENIFKDLPTLETERLILRKINLKDAADIFQYASDPLLTKHTLWATHTSIEDSKYFIEAVMLEYRKHLPTSWGIEHKRDSKLIGTCGFIYWDRHDSRAEIGYALSRQYWGQGYMTEAVQAIIDVGFCQMNLNRIEARCNLANKASAQVMEKVGMKFEGILRKHIFAKGVYCDLKMYSLLREEWA
jgi:ribosomal-protein-alanine N-acetyltransferase